MATIKDVAARAGVSFKTVSRVLNGEPHVRSALVERVREAIRELGYRPVEAARMLATRKSNVIAAPILPVAASYISRMLIALTQECRRKRHYLVPEVFESRDDVLDWTAQMPVQPHAVILFSPFEDDMDLIGRLQEQGIKVVRIAPSKPGYGIGIPVPEIEVTMQLMEHLLQLGHRRIGMIAPPLPANATEERVVGYRRALKRAGIAFDESLLIRGQFIFDDGVIAARRLLALDSPPTAIFAASDDMALGAMAVARELGLDVPGDLAIAGFDDNIEATKMYPALTTVHQPLEEIARAAVRAAIEDGPVEPDFRQTLMVRGSTIGQQRALTVYDQP